MQAAQHDITARTELDHWWFVARRRILRELIAEVCPGSADWFLVDAGCSTGGNIAMLEQYYTCLGVDASPEAIALARQRCPDAHFLCGSVPEDLKDVAARTDAFLLADFLQHVENDSDTLASLVHAAQPGACFLITVPADTALWGRHDESHGHFRRYDVESLARLWQGLPVSVCLLSYFNSRLYWPIRMVRTINRWRGCAYGEADTDLKMPARPMNWILERIFAGERRRLLRLLRGETNRPYRRGVSLIALLRREPDSFGQEAAKEPQIDQVAIEPEGVSCASASS